MKPAHPSAPAPVTPSADRRLGLWLVGARGSISTCLVYGLHGLREGSLAPTGLCTARGPFADLGLREFSQIVLGGHDVCTRSLSESARELVENGILPPALVESGSHWAAAYESRLRPGTLDGPDVGFADLDPRSAQLSARSPREQALQLARDIEEFRQRERLERVVVVYAASTEAWRAPDPAWEEWSRFEAALDGGAAQPASLLYAYAAFQAGAAFVNFTPNLGSSVPALRELARHKRLAHCGNDGKTGETLIKTVLAPMFAARNLKVLAWQGYNILGNRDGQVLSESTHRASKVRNKNEALRSLLGDEQVHTHVGIDYVPSLQDWKTAWDFIHFEGFLGARMSLQFTWTGSDSALAAPLVLDLVRLVDHAAGKGEFGELGWTAPFFKAPLAGGSHDFHLQFQGLLEHVQGWLKPQV